MPSRATRAAGTRQGTCASCTGGAITGITSGWDTKRQRLEPDAEQSARPVLRGLGSGNGARLPAFVYGRRKQEVSPGDPPLVAERRRPMEEWDIVVPDTYPAYIGYDQYLVNRRHLRDNLYNFAARDVGR